LIGDRLVAIAFAHSDQYNTQNSHVHQAPDEDLTGDISVPAGQDRMVLKPRSHCSDILLLIYKSLSGSFDDIVTLWPKAGLVEPEETSVARQRRDKQLSAATDSHATLEELLEAIFLYAICPEVM
jgi:hypothetical protein